MSDSQIVSSIIEKNYNYTNSKVGERYIMEHDGKYHISEYDGTKWIIISKDYSHPKYIFVSDIMKTVILFGGKFWKQNKWFICSECEKLTLQKMKYMKGMVELCVHCFFKLHHDNPNKKEYDGCPLTIGKYIHTYARQHKSDKCSDPSKCFLCDYKNGKLLLDINDRNIIYKGKLIDLLKSTSIDITI